MFDAQGKRSKIVNIFDGRNSRQMASKIRSRAWFVGGVFLLAIAIFATRYYEVDLPVWRFFTGDDVGVDAATLHLHGEFVESNLGVTRAADQPVTVRLIAQQYLFVPECIEVPAGVPVRFRITSADVVHMLTISDTDFKLKAVPGAVNEARYEFAAPGEHVMPCREFCGPGHYAMRARVVVVPKEQFAKLQPGDRGACGPG
jgi:cytochrome c oxidase subunit 2